MSTVKAATAEFSMNQNKLTILPLIMFFSAASFYLYEFFIRVAPSALYAHLMSDFHMAATDLGILSSSFFISYSLCQFPAGALIDKFGPRRLIAFALLVSGIGTYVFSQTTSFPVAIMCRLAIGAVSAFAFVGCLKVITIWFPPKWFPVFSGFTLTLGSMGAIAGGALISLALKHFEWRPLLHHVAIMGFVFAAIVYLVIRDENDHQVVEAHEHETVSGKHLTFLELFASAIKKPQNWIIGLYGLLVTAPVDAFGGLWGVAFLEQAHGLDHVHAASTVSTIFVGFAIGSPMFGWLSTYLKSRKKAMYLSSGLAFVSISGILFLRDLPPFALGSLFFLFGAGGTFVLSFVVVRDVNPHGLVGTAVGFINMLANLGSASLQVLIGVLLDKFGHAVLQKGVPVFSLLDYQVSLSLLPLCYFLCLVVFIPRIKESYPATK